MPEATPNPDAPPAAGQDAKPNPPSPRYRRDAVTWSSGPMCCAIAQDQHMS